MPVWGYGRVRESHFPGIEAGAELYGFFPITKSMDMQPGGLNTHGFTDMAVHRSGLHSLYSRYSFTRGAGLASFGIFQDGAGNSLLLKVARRNTRRRFNIRRE